MENLTERIDELFAEQRGEEAKMLLEQALEDSYEKQDFIGAVPILNELIGYCRETSRVQQSFEYANKVQELLQKTKMEGTLPHATTLLNVANAYRAGGQLEESLQLYGQVKDMYEELLEPEDMLWASFYNNLSLLYQELNRFDLAKESLLKALSIVVQKKDTIFEQAVTYANLANTCLQLNQDDEAAKYFTGAILLFEKYEIRDTHYCAALSSMGTYYFRRKEYETAAQYFEKAMQGIEAHLGRNEYYLRMEENALLCRELIRINAACKGEGETEKKDETHALKKISGLELCREYYEVYCKPMLAERFSDYVDRIAVGLVGEGSDCFGYDDAFSMDHDWGPALCLWVSDSVYEEIGEVLQEAYDELPKEYKGYVYKSSSMATNRRGVFRTEEFYHSLLGAENCPKEGEPWSESTINWADIKDERLAAAVNGEVFARGDGTFGEIREILKSYPKKLRFLKIAEAAARFSQSGQYNLNRMWKRKDKVAAGLMASDALKEAMKLLYYMAEVYPPHDKWLYHGLVDREEYATVLQLMERCMEVGLEQKESVLEQIGEELAALLYRKGYISDVGSFLQEHVGELLCKAEWITLCEKELADRIARTEFEAFDRVKNHGGRADCQDDWFTFSIMRKSQYYTWTQEMLMQYLFDFQRELALGHNLIEEKYGRMMESTAPQEYEKIKDRFPVLSAEKKRIIEEVVRMQVNWMEEFAKEYPRLAGNARSIHTREDHLYNTSYETYLRGEISTYSDKMLQLYAEYIVSYARSGKNPTQDIMEQSVLLYGYEGLKEAEAML